MGESEALHLNRLNRGHNVCELFPIGAGFYRDTQFNPVDQLAVANLHRLR